MANKKFKSKIQADAGVLITSETASRALVLDGSGNVISSATTATEIGYVSGVTSSVQDQLDAKADASDVTALVTLSGVAAGETDLGTFSGSIIPDDSDIKEALQALETEIEGLPSPFFYAGTWAASTNTPTLADGVGTSGAVYYVSDAGTVDFGAGDIVFAAGDRVVYNGTTWDKWDTTDAVASVFGRVGAVTAQSGDYNTSQVTENTNLYFTDERAQDAVGTILVDSSSIDFTYTDATPSITAVVLPAGVDHDALANFVANEHIDHSTVVLSGATNGGIATTIGDITASRSISVDITNAVAETSADNADLILIYDNSATAIRKMTRSNFLSGIAISSAGDINETPFSLANNQAAAADVTGLAFAAASVRGFKVLASVEIDATTDTYETFELVGVNKNGSFDMAVESVGDDSGIVFTVTSAGQVQYTSTNNAGFVDGTIRFRAITTNF